MKGKQSFLKVTLAGGALIALLLVGIIVVLDDERTSETFIEDRSESTRGEAFPGMEHPEGPSVFERIVAGVDPARVLADYKKWAVYPPNSRPLEEGHVDVLRHREVPLTYQAMPVVKDGRLQKSDYSCRLQPERHTVTEGEVMRVMLSCMKTGVDAYVPLRIDGSRLKARAGVREFTPVQPTVNDSGLNGDDTAGDHVHTFEFRPRRSDWARMSLDVRFAIEGDPTLATHNLSASFFSSPVAPARFLSIKQDEIREGSLIVTTELDVREPGKYTVEANLFAGEEPVAYARAEHTLHNGKQTVELSFYGKIFHDRGHAGPYTLKGLRGSLNTNVIQPEMLAGDPAEVERFLSNVREDRPKRKIMPYFNGTYNTAKYPLDVFTTAEYDSPEKRERIARLIGMQSN